MTLDELLGIEFRTCRLCRHRTDAEELLKYSVRSYGHAACLTRRFSVYGVLSRIGSFHYGRYLFLLRAGDLANNRDLDAIRAAIQKEGTR